MGKASRRKRERQDVVIPVRPRWAGAPGFDRAYQVAERYVDVAQRMDAALADERPVHDLDRRHKIATVMQDVAYLRLDEVDRQVAMLRHRAVHLGHDLSRDDPRDPVVVPGQWDELVPAAPERPG
jgi:hypothetical protein